jgi:hypothetical protein
MILLTIIVIFTIIGLLMFGAHKFSEYAEKNYYWDYGATLMITTFGGYFLIVGIILQCIYSLTNN